MGACVEVGGGAVSLAGYLFQDNAKGKATAPGNLYATTVYFHPICF